MNGRDTGYSLEQRPPPMYQLPVYGTLFCPNQLTVFLGGRGPPSPIVVQNAFPYV
jgi:hypothetical protein